MHVTFSSGSATQRSWVNEAIARSTFPWDQITTSALVLFDQPTDENPHDGLTTFAWTDPRYDLTDTCGRPDAAFMTLRPNLDTFVHNFGVPDRRHPDNPLNSAIDTVHHELGHIVASKIYPADVPLIADCFGRDIGSWGDDHNLPWNERVIEAFCETFKDFYLGEHRQWNNRTNMRLRFDKRDQFLDVLDRVCACWGSDPTLYSGEYVWVDAGGWTTMYQGTRPPEGAVIIAQDSLSAADYPAHSHDLHPVAGGEVVYYQWQLPPALLLDPFPLRFEVEEGGNILYWHEFQPKTTFGWYAKIIPGGSPGVRFFAPSTAAGELKMFRLLPDARAACAPKSRPAWPYGGDPAPDPPPPPYVPAPIAVTARLSASKGGVRRYNRRVV